jgi:hypothetical protein
MCHHYKIDTSIWEQLIKQERQGIPNFSYTLLYIPFIKRRLQEICFFYRKIN